MIKRSELRKNELCIMTQNKKDKFITFGNMQNYAERDRVIQLSCEIMYT